MPRWTRHLVALAGVTLAAAVAASAAPASAPHALKLTIARTSQRPVVPPSFLGLSVEMKALPQISRYAEKGDLATLLRSVGPGVLRFGGVTVDTQTAWSRDGSLPSWANTAITPSELAGVDGLMRKAGWRAILGVNLGHYNPGSAADEVAHARHEFGTELAGIEIGNEPNGFPTIHLRPSGYGWSDYKGELDRYLQAIGQAFPLAGPAAEGRVAPDWMRNEAAQEHPAILTGHYYPTSYCHSYLPVPGDLLNARIRGAEQRMLARYANVAAATGLPVRLSETNNVACGGEPGVSNTFASALWAVDYVARAMSAGLAGINFHDIISNCGGYAPLCTASSGDASSGQLTAQPEWYALLMTSGLVGSQPLASRLSSHRADVTAAAFRTRSGRLQLVLVNDSARPVPVKAAVGRAFAFATVLRLTGPSMAATAGIRLGGASVRRDGSFAPQRQPRVPVRKGGLSVMLPPTSAALVVVSPRGAPARPTFGL